MPNWFVKTMEEIINYIGTTCKNYTTDFTTALEDLDLTNPVKPVALDPGDHVLLNDGRFNLNNTSRRYKNMLAFSWDYTTLFWGQCTQAMREWLKSCQNFHAVSQNGIRPPMTHLPQLIHMSTPSLVHLQARGQQ